MFEVSVDCFDLVFFGYAGEFRLSVDHPGMKYQLRIQRLTVCTWQHMRKIKGTPKVAPAVFTARKCHQVYARGTHGFSGFQVSAESLLTERNRNAVPGRREVRLPLTGPTAGKVDSPIVKQKPQIGESTVAGGSVAAGGNGMGGI